MKKHLYLKHMLFAVSLCMVSTLLPMAEAGELQSRKPAAGSKTIVESGMAAGAVEDTLDACMARIPKDASAGQRMIAEQGCRRDESDRTQYLPAPGRPAGDRESRH